jgi:amidase
MRTTSGSHALVNSIPSGDAPVVANLRMAGAIILGKANLSELAYFKGTDLPCGWSAVGGQTLSAYGPGGFSEGVNADGSSSGSAVGVSAGFAAGAIGTDTTGSNLEPASRAALFGMRASVGLISRAGVLPTTSTGDTLGPLAKSAYDAALLLGAMGGYDKNDPASKSPKNPAARACGLHESLSD